jgi:hypothetical protein
MEQHILFLIFIDCRGSNIKGITIYYATEEKNICFKVQKCIF